ncbi:2-octaprenyl-6-methoxyphenyl hydroxylase [Vibrio algarum]|uniref:2-octaprenyl-6-methoxyphenyl hydroxylase n=1 Tax=Vibrio algarum TaxID=3020714 RepID=A0ABT4YTJ7_9VIBR|nr:2-octaprenyl-6-methoxyphenyl hydroxylase [Vibrio sp. KJ40-1]MDB1124886.1 2-octaprenyl-6-methoxyphenyl hydroxylase [Vibrio sp. KJ40-1]
MKTYDIAIAGGAMAGATLALALSQASNGALSIAVVEPFRVDKDNHPGFDSRSIALSYGTKLILEQFKLWSKIEPLTTAINHIHVSDRGHAGMTEIDKNEENVAALGYVVELAAVGSLYSQLISQSGNIDYFCPDSVASISRDIESNLIKLGSGNELRCKLLVAADGADSICSHSLGHSNSELDFNQTAVIANVEVSEKHNGRAFERFTTSGPLALLPMSKNRMSVVWCLEPTEAEKVVRLPEETFIAQLQHAFGWRLGKITKVGTAASYPLVLKQKDQVVSHRFATVGNAAQLLHPIAGQGFNLGIRDIASLVDCITGKKDVGDYSVLSQYRECREHDRTQTISLIAGMVSVFSNDWLSLRIGRNLALMTMDNIPLFKSPLLRRTMGLVKR